MGECETPELPSVEKQPEEIRILGPIVNRVQEICYPVQTGAPKPLFPVFPLKVVLMGKPFAGKTSALNIAEKGTLIVCKDCFFYLPARFQPAFTLIQIIFVNNLDPILNLNQK